MAEREHAERKRAEGMLFRQQVRETDREAVASLIQETGFFSAAEQAVAIELVDERLRRGEASGYRFVVADRGGEVEGYCCYGEIPCTVGSFDLYWIAVRPRAQGLGLGRALLVEAERCMARLGGRRIYIETSNREQYRPTRAFYQRCGYIQAAVLAQFYGPDDDKVIYVKQVISGSPA